MVLTDAAGVTPAQPQPVAWGLFAFIEGEGWVLQFPVRATRQLAEGDKAMYSPDSKLQVLPLTAGVEAAPRALDAAEVYRLAREHGVILEDDNGAVPAFWCIPMGRLLPLAHALAAGVKVDAPALPEPPSFRVEWGGRVVAWGDALAYGRACYEAGKAGVRVLGEGQQQ